MLHAFSSPGEATFAFWVIALVYVLFLVGYGAYQLWWSGWSSWAWWPMSACLALAYLLFKLLSYEARRYRETAPDLPPGLRQ